MNAESLDTYVCKNFAYNTKCEQIYVFDLVRHTKNPQKFIHVSCKSKIENEEKRNLNDIWMRRDEFNFSTIDEQNQIIEIRTNGIRMCPNAYCLRQPSCFVCFLLVRQLDLGFFW